MTRHALLEVPDQLCQIAGTDQRLVRRHNEHRVEAAAQRAEPCPHRALLALRMRRVVHERYRETLHLSLDRLTRGPGHDDHLVNTGTTEGDELPANKRYPLKPYERLRHATHASTFAGCQQHRA